MTEPVVYSKEVIEAAKAVLKDTRELISDKNRWAHGAFARDKDGNAVDVHSPLAYSFCAHGALLYVMDKRNPPNRVSVSDKIWTAIDKILGHRSLIGYNDGSTLNGAGVPTGYDDVLQLFDTVISVLDAEVSHGT